MAVWDTFSRHGEFDWSNDEFKESGGWRVPKKLDPTTVETGNLRKATNKGGHSGHSKSYETFYLFGRNKYLFVGSCYGQGATGRLLGNRRRGRERIRWACVYGNPRHLRWVVNREVKMSPGRDSTTFGQLSL